MAWQTNFLTLVQRLYASLVKNCAVLVKKLLPDKTAQLKRNFEFDEKMPSVRISSNQLCLVQFNAILFYIQKGVKRIMVIGIDLPNSFNLTECQNLFSNFEWGQVYYPISQFAILTIKYREINGLSKTTCYIHQTIIHGKNFDLNFKHCWYNHVRCPCSKS